MVGRNRKPFGDDGPIMPESVDADTVRVRRGVKSASKGDAEARGRWERMPRWDREGDWRPIYLAWVRAMFAPKKAALSSGIGWNRVLAERKANPGWWDKVLEAQDDCVDNLEAELFKRSAERSDALLIFALKSWRPERYSERYQAPVPTDVNVTLSWGDAASKPAQIEGDIIDAETE